MPVVTDPAFKLLYGLDQSANLATRINSGSLGTAQDLSVFQSSGTDGIPPISDDRGGKAVDVFLTRTGYTSAERCLRAAQAVGSAHTAAPAFPKTLASDDFAFGMRFQWRAGNTGGGANETEFFFGLMSVASAGGWWGLGVFPNDPTTPTAGKLRLYAMGSVITVDAISWTTGGGPAVDYINPSEWYRVLVRLFYSGTGARAKVYVYRESTGVTYTFTLNADLSTSNEAAWLLLTDTAVHVSYLAISSTFPIYAGYVDECWLYDSPMSDSDATTTVVGGFQVPWVEPSYLVSDADVRVSYVNESGDFPPDRQLPVGGLAPDHEVNVFCKRFRVKYIGFRASRPWAIRRADFKIDTLGRFSPGKKGNVLSFADITGGLVRLPGRLPPGVCVDVRNVEFSGTGPRRRRGFRGRRSVDTSVTYGHNSFFSWRDSSDTLYMGYKAGSKLYAETGSGASQIDTGWQIYERVVHAMLDNRLILVSPSRRKSWRGSSTAVESFGIATPAAPTTALVAGGLTGTFLYAYTEYDPTTGDESYPAIAAATVSPAAQGVQLTLAAVSSDTRFSQRRIYRTVNGGSAPDLFRVATITSATSYTDTGLADGTIPVGRIVTSDGELVEYFSGNPPANFVGCCLHMNRMFYWYGNTLYWTPEYEPQRFSSTDSLTADGPIKAVASLGYRLVVFTANTTEIIETDFVRDGLGVPQIRRNVASRNVGCASPHSPVLYDDDLYWIDRRGVYKLIGDRVIKISGAIDNLFRFLNVGYASYISGAVNHLRNQVWWTCAFGSIQDDNTRFQTTVVMIPPEENKGIRWTLHEIEASFYSQFDDDLNGIRFGCIDHIGEFKELESYEGDGAQGSDSGIEDDDGVSSVAGNVVTVSPSPAWTTNQHRGKGVVFRDATTHAIQYFLIVANGAATLTLATSPPTWLGSGDGYYLGGMNAYIEIAEQDADTPNDKRITHMQTEFDDLTMGRFV